MSDASGKTIVHDYQLTAIGGALVALGFRFNSLEPAELEKAGDLLMQVRPHLLAIESDYQPAMRTGEAWLTMCWSNDACQMHRDAPEIAMKSQPMAARSGRTTTPSPPRRTTSPPPMP